MLAASLRRQGVEADFERISSAGARQLGARPAAADGTPSVEHRETQDRKLLKRINALIKDIERNGNEGIGKPEPLKHGFHGYWSRRISDEHRLIHKIIDSEIRIAACRYRYGI